MNDSWPGKSWAFITDEWDTGVLWGLGAGAVNIDAGCTPVVYLKPLGTLVCNASFFEGKTGTFLVYSVPPEIVFKLSFLEGEVKSFEGEAKLIDGIACFLPVSCSTTTKKENIKVYFEMFTY